MMTTRPTSPRMLGKGWQHLAQLSPELVVLTDEADILRRALLDILDLLHCEGAEVVLNPFAGRAGLLAGVEAGAYDGQVQVTEVAPGEPTGRRREWSLSVPLLGSTDQIGTLRLVQRRWLRKGGDTRLAFAFALLLAGSLTAVRALEAERLAVEATYQRVMLDGLTSLGSRSLLVERGNRSLTGAKEQGKTAALLLFDVDGFKRVNDTLGHHAGDRVLAEFGLRLRRGVRDGDLAVRLGGDEFAVLTAPLNSPEEAEFLATRLQQELSLPVMVDDVELTVRCSVGIAMYGEDGEDIRDLLRAADLAMYAAKGVGPGLWQRYGATSRALAERRSTIAEDLGRGCLDEQLVLHYQPQVHAWSGQVTGFETLARWEHPTLGLLAPSEFVPLAERVGLMSGLTILVLDRALSDYLLLQQMAEGCSLSVNISARNLLGRGLVADVARLLAAHDVPAEQLTLEVSEPPLGVSPGLTENLVGLVKLGCQVSVSEVGTGSSSLMAVSRHAGIRELKLDSSLVADIIGDPAADRLARAIIGTAHALDVRVVAEGVESRDIVTRMRDLGCDVLQGYFVRPPAVLDEIRHWVEAWPLQRDEKIGEVMQEST